LQRGSRQVTLRPLLVYPVPAAGTTQSAQVRDPCDDRRERSGSRRRRWSSPLDGSWAGTTAPDPRL